MPADPARRPVHGWAACAAAVLLLALAGCSTGRPPSAPPPSHRRRRRPGLRARRRARPRRPQLTRPRRPLSALLSAGDGHRGGERGLRQRDRRPVGPYINSLARQFGLATAMDAGYPPSCPSLAAYLLLTSGDRHRICDDSAPPSHPLNGDSIFSQVAATGRQWRGYAESMPANCALQSTRDGVYLVRHAPAPYYLRERAHCRTWDVPLGTLAAGHLHDDLAAGALPAFSFVTPNSCHDMHGAPSCRTAPVAAGDAWLKQWMPAILASPDYTSGRLVVLIVWDEAGATSNHIPALVISPSTHHVADPTRWTHCSTLRTVEDLLGVPPLGCAATATSMVAAFALANAG